MLKLAALISNFSREQAVLERRRLECRILEILEGSEIPSTVEFPVDVPESEAVKLWEMKLGCLMACCPLISTTDQEHKLFLRKLQAVTSKLIKDDEINVRLAAGKL